MTNTITDNKKRSHKRKYIIIAAIGVIIVLDMFVFGFVKFAYQTVRCGNIPVAITPSILGQGTYILPGNYIPGWADTNYVCTESEAIEQGIAKNLYSNQPALNNGTLGLMVFAGIMGIVCLWWWRVKTRLRAKTNEKSSQ